MTEPAAIDLQTTPRGVLLAVRAQPGSRRDAITGVHAGALKVAVTAAPDKGKANDAIVALLADRLDLARAQITVAVGETARHKKLLVTGITAEELRRRIAACLHANR